MKDASSTDERTVRWGVLSTAKIGVVKVIPAIRSASGCAMTAIASRDLAKAKAAAERLAVPKAYGSYEELLSDPEIDAIYNPLPNHLHVPWSIKALEAGKHVLCEKPIGLTSKEGEELVGATRRFPHLKVMEAFMYRHHPQWRKARQLVEDGEIGEPRTIHSFFSYFNDNPADIRNMAEIGGGGLWDIGCYCVSLSRFLFGAEPKRVCGMVEYDPRFATDRLSSGMLDFEAGSATFTCSTQLDFFQTAHVFGTEGRVEIEIPFTAPPDRPCRIWLHRGGERREIVFDICNQYSIQAELFARAVLDDVEVPTPIEDAVANMKVLEALVRSHERGEWCVPR